MNAPDELAKLTAAAQDLVDRINALNTDKGEVIESLAVRSVVNRRWIRIIFAGFVLDIALTVAMAFGWAQIARNNHRIDLVTQRLDVAQTTQRAKALCPLYKVFLDSERFTPPNQTPEQAAARVEAFKIIHSGYDALACNDLLLHK